MPTQSGSAIPTDALTPSRAKESPTQATMLEPASVSPSNLVFASDAPSAVQNQRATLTSSSMPSMDPTELASRSPSIVRSAIPSPSPSVDPTGVDSSGPTASPRGQSSSSPSTGTTLYPSMKTSRMPSTQRSVIGLAKPAGGQCHCESAVLRGIGFFLDSHGGGCEGDDMVDKYRQGVS